MLDLLINLTMVDLDGMIRITLRQIGVDHLQILILLDMGLLKSENILFVINVEN
jgi:hypothetical protein